jgi:hypothetical protein
MNIEYNFIPNTFHYVFIRLQRNKGLWLRSVPLHISLTCTVKRALMELLWTFLCWIAKILCVDTTRWIKVCFICLKDNDVVRQKIRSNAQLPCYGLPCHDRLSLAPPRFCTHGSLDPCVKFSPRCDRIFLEQQNAWDSSWMIVSAPMFCGDRTVRILPSERKHSVWSFLPITVWYCG